MHVDRRLYLIYRLDRPLNAAALALVEIIRGKTSRAGDGRDQPADAG
jgi:hypothetical protein